MPALKTIALPATLLFLLGAGLLVFHEQGLTEEAIAGMIRVTAASSMLLFSLTFSASSLHHFLKNGRWQPVMQARRRLGLSFALSHAAHLIAIIALVELAYGGDYSQLGNIAGGSVIYLFILAMAVTSNKASVNLLGAKNWKRLHTAGSYLIWLGLFGSYLGKALETGAIHYWLLFLCGVALLLLRILAFLDIWRLRPRRWRKQPSSN